MNRVMENIDWENIHFQELETILQVGVKDMLFLNETLSMCLTPLCLACKFKREDLLTVLLHHGARVDKGCSCHGRLPLHFACDHSSGNRGMVLKLLEASVDIDAQDNTGNTGLNLACENRNIPVALLLIEHHANVNHMNINGISPLLHACILNCAELVDILLKAGCKLNGLRENPIQLAIRCLSVTTLNLLIAAGADLDEEGYLNEACAEGNYSIVKALLEGGAKVNRPNNIGFSPLMSACYMSSEKIVKLLLEWGADVHACTIHGYTLLHNAFCFPDDGKIKLLLAYGADVNAKDYQKRCPLMKLVDTIWHHSHSNNMLTIVHLLLAAGCKLPHNDFRIASLVQKENNWDNTLNFLACAANNPRDLQSECRIAIRKHIPPNIDENVNKLPLPPLMIKFLKFNNIISPNKGSGSSVVTSSDPHAFITVNL